MNIINNIYVCNPYDMHDFFKAWYVLNSDYNIKFYDSEMCRDFILANCGLLYCQVYDFLEDQIIKDFFWHLCVLYKKGGICVSSSITPLMPLKILMEEKTELLLCLHEENEELMFNSSFLASQKQNILIRSCIMWYVTRYQNDKSYSYENYDCCKCMMSCTVMDKENIVLMDNIKVQLLKKKENSITYNGIVFFNSDEKSFNYIETRKIKLCVLMFYTEEEQYYAKVIHEINKKYCENHDIDIFITNECSSEKHVSWEPIAMVLQKLQQYDYVITLTSNCLFYCPGKNIYSIIESNDHYDIIMSNENDSINSNVVIIKNTEYSFNTLKELFCNDNNLELNEILNEQYSKNNYNLKDHTKVYEFGYIFSYSEQDKKYFPFILDTGNFDVVKRNKLVRRHFRYYFNQKFDENILINA